jgi:hypothetical protein
MMREKTDAQRCILGAIFSNRDIYDAHGYTQHAKSLLEEGYYDENEFVKKLIAGEPDLFVYSIVETEKPKYKLYYIGRPWDTISLTETGDVFRESVSKKLEIIFKKSIWISTLIIPKNGDSW